MMKVYLCPKCGNIRIVSRRKQVECLRCGEQMLLDKMDFLEYTEKSQEEREAYAAEWLKKIAEKG